MAKYNVYDVLKERGYIAQTSNDEEVRRLLNEEEITYYIGFDATADSLTLGHFLIIMTMMHMERAGHRPIALLGGGTTLVGDPSGRNEMRSIMTIDDINANAEKFKSQMERFLDIEGGKSLIENNADWLVDLNFLDFMREVGVHFGVNRMLAMESYENRLKDGLTFFEFSYLLLQSYDFLVLNRKHNAIMQMGGSDQWSNIIGGIELIRKAEQKSAYALTFELLTTAAGEKMGKTSKGAIWLDPNKTPPYEMFQYLRNVADLDVEPFLKLLTFLDLEEIESLVNVEGSQINKAKEVLAFEVVKTIHGEDEAKKALDTSRSLFEGQKDDSNIPSTHMDKKDFEDGIGLLNLMTSVGLSSSNGEARRLIQSGGVYLNETQVKDFSITIGLDNFEDGKLLLRRGKKTHHQIILD